MKYVLVDNYDNIVHTVVLNGAYTQVEAQQYFVNLKQIDKKEFKKLWKVMSEEKYLTQHSLSLYNRQSAWWKEDKEIIDDELQH